MTSKNKIEVIEINLGLDVHAEIRKHADNLSDISTKTDAIVAKIKARAAQRPISKKEAETRDWETKLVAIHSALKTAASSKTPYRTMAQIIEDTKVTMSESDSIKFPAKFKNYVEKLGGGWELLKKKVQGKTCYAVARFGEQNLDPGPA